MFLFCISSIWLHRIKLEKTLSSFTKDLWGQRSGRGTLTSYILVIPSNNIIFIFICKQFYYNSCHILSLNTFRRNIYVKLWYFSKKYEPTPRALKVNISKKITNCVDCNSFVCSVCVCLWACYCLLSSFCISGICFHHINLEQTLSCCMKDLLGQRSGWGTSTSYFLSTPCNNRIFIFIVINSFNTTLVTYCHWIHFEWNIDEVMIFFRKHEPTLRSPKVIFSNKKNRLPYMCMIMSMLMSVVFILYICHLVPSYQVIKTLFCCAKDLWGQKSEWGTLTSYILTTLCDKKILICIVIRSCITNLPTLRHWIHSVRNTCQFFIVSNPPLDR